MKNPVQKFITNNSYKLLLETSVQTILNNCYQSIPNIFYKLLSDKPFHIILTNYYQTLLSTTIWEFIPSDSCKNFYQRTLETTLTNLLSKNHFKQYISTKSFRTIHYKLLPEKSLQTILTNYYKINDFNTKRFLKYVWPFFNTIFMKQLP